MSKLLQQPPCILSITVFSCVISWCAVLCCAPQILNTCRKLQGSMTFFQSEKCAPFVFVFNDLRTLSVVDVWVSSQQHCSVIKHCPFLKIKTHTPTGLHPLAGMKERCKCCNSEATNFNWHGYRLLEVTASYPRSVSLTDVLNLMN